MKTIKFRIPIKCSQCDFKGFQYYEWNGQSFTPDGYDKCEHDKMEIVGEPQQFTGLIDKNGKEIYENDIVKSGNGRVWNVKFGEFIYTEPKQTAKGYGFYLEPIEEEFKKEGNCYLNNGIEVIGDIFSNPELLNQH